MDACLCREEPHGAITSLCNYEGAEETAHATGRSWWRSGPGSELRVGPGLV